MMRLQSRWFPACVVLFLIIGTKRVLMTITGRPTQGSVGNARKTG